MKPVRVFRYIEALDAFVVTDEYREIAERLHLNEWNPVVWIGRLFTLDNDFGEHWFDNWELREQKEIDAQQLGIDSFDLMIIDPDRFRDNRNGPCHTPEFRKRFWTDVLKNLELSPELLFDEARQFNDERRQYQDKQPDYIEDFDCLVQEIIREYRFETDAG